MEFIEEFVMGAEWYVFVKIFVNRINMDLSLWAWVEKTDFGH